MRTTSYGSTHVYIYTHAYMYIYACTHIRLCVYIYKNDGYICMCIYIADGNPSESFQGLLSSASLVI